MSLLCFSLKEMKTRVQKAWNLAKGHCPTKCGSAVKSNTVYKHPPTGTFSKALCWLWKSGQRDYTPCDSLPMKQILEQVVQG